jgi:hypothetical protein
MADDEACPPLEGTSANGAVSARGGDSRRRRTSLGPPGAASGLGMTGSGCRDARLAHSAAGCGLPIASCRRLALLRAARPGRGGQALLSELVGRCRLSRHTAGGQALPVAPATLPAGRRCQSPWPGVVPFSAPSAFSAVTGPFGSLGSFGVVRVLLGPAARKILREIPRIMGPNRPKRDTRLSKTEYHARCPGRVPMELTEVT